MRATPRGNRTTVAVFGLRFCCVAALAAGVAMHEPAPAGAQAKSKTEAKSVADWLLLLKSRNSDVRKEACVALGKAGAEAAVALPALREATKDEFFFVRLSATEAVQKIEAALPAGAVPTGNEKSAPTAPGFSSVCFVIDTSASMARIGEFVKLEMVKAVHKMHPNQMFNVVWFGEGAPVVFAPKMNPAEDGNKERLGFRIRDIRFGGTSDARAGLTAGMDVRPLALYVLTDRDVPADLVESLTKGNKRQVRIHAIGFHYGDSRDFANLRKAAEKNRGRFREIDATDYVKAVPASIIDAPVAKTQTPKGDSPKTGTPAAVGKKAEEKKPTSKIDPPKTDMLKAVNPFEKTIPGVDPVKPPPGAKVCAKCGIRVGPREKYCFSCDLAGFGVD